ncbi:secreted RxLR effector protein 161-like [Solanum lycopersicum]|uniref:secreted RxLR effector protein 161-like n=1 Tax=Solanum lycopersicum TaxID=4081 RepID=UPI003748C3B3
MDDAKPIDTPIAPATKLDLEGTGSAVEQKLYRGMIGSLLYLTASRTDIVFSVGLCARFQTNPKESHIQAVKRILRYLKGTSDLGLWYPKGSNFDLVGYADADYAGYLGDRKSTTGMAHFLGSCLISWGSKKRNSVALSTAEAEYVAVHVAPNFCGLSNNLVISVSKLNKSQFSAIILMLSTLQKIQYNIRELNTLTFVITFLETMWKRV